MANSIQIPESWLKDKKKTIFDIYKFFLDYFLKKYGSHTVILMQVGSFYELYGVDNDKMKIGMVKEVAALLNIEVTRRNKEIRENNTKNHLMAGFPDAALHKFADILVEHLYTVVVIDQQGTAKDRIKNYKLPRKVSYILSPGTYLNERNAQIGDNRFLVQIHLEGYKSILKKAKMYGSGGTDLAKSNYQPMLIGISAIDVTTGQSDIYEVSNSINDQDYAINEIYRYLQTHPATEIIISTNGINIGKNELKNYLKLDNRNLRYQFNYNAVDSSYYKLSYQKECLDKVFSPDRRNSMLSVIEYLNLERSPSALVSYLQLLQFTYEHNETLLLNLKPPKIWETSNLLLLANTTISQLELSNSNTTRMGSICNMLNLTSTGMGRRLFRERFLNPIRDPIQLKKRYDRVSLFVQNDFWRKMEDKLKGLQDLDRTHRRIELGLISPNGFSLLWDTYNQIGELLEIVPDDLLPTSQNNFRNEYNEYMNYLKSTLDFDETFKYTFLDKIEDNIFKAGYNSELDEIAGEIRQSNHFFTVIINKLSKLITGIVGNPVLTLKNTEASGYYLNVTAIRYKKMLEELEKKPLEFRVGKFQVKLDKNSFKIVRSNKEKTNHNIMCDVINEFSDRLSESVKLLKKKIKIVYMDFLDKLINDYRSLYDRLGYFIAEMDVYKANAKAALKYRFNRPEVIEAKSEKHSSWLRAINFRHPLIEQLNQNCYYVPHSLQLGSILPDRLNKSQLEQIKKSKNDVDLNINVDGEIPERDGYLITGVNSSGKTAIMKAIGVNLVMAQAGMFVAADNFMYIPYHRILTRILGNDDIYRGDSSFTVEIREIRDVEIRADQNSLVLGDEPCRGTDVKSGFGIVAALLHSLGKKGAHYMFATHLHELFDDEEVMALCEWDETRKHKMGVFHLQVDYDANTHELVYDRRLKNGPGNPMYGIEVARALDLKPDFIKEAHRFRKKIMGKSKRLAETKTSRYNSQIIMNVCAICGENGIGEAPLETDHIKEQKNADNNGYIGSMHKNQAKNLVPLCKNCHRKKTAGDIVINGWIETSSGRKLNFEEKKTKLKFIKRIK